ncbi:MAG: hypothetical protein QM831_19865 [Kofleriaceae bacterium]
MKAVIALIVIAGLGYGAWHYFGPSNAMQTDGVSTYTAHKEKFIRHVIAEGNLKAVKATKISAPRGAGDFGPMKVAWLAADGTYVKKGEVIAKFDPSEPNKRLRDGESDLASANAKYASEQIKSKAAVATRNVDEQTATSELDQQKKFAAKDPEIYSRNTIIESEIDEHLADAKASHAAQAKQIEGKRSQSNSAVIAVEKQKAQLAVDHAKKELQSMELTAPNDGILVLDRNWRGQMRKVGDSLFPGMGVGEIPELSAMEAEVFVLEVDGSGLVEKQSADVVVEAHPEISFHGQIRVVDKLAQPQNDGSPVNYFGVKISLDKTDNTIMKPGQRVQATLVLDQEDAIVLPRQAVFEKEGKPTVYKKSATGWTPEVVELGAATAGRVVIKKGITDGDVIALRDPTQTLDQLGSAGSGSAAK